MCISKLPIDLPSFLSIKVRKILFLLYIIYSNSPHYSQAALSVITPSISNAIPKELNQCNSYATIDSHNITDRGNLRGAKTELLSKSRIEFKWNE